MAAGRRPSMYKDPSGKKFVPGEPRECQMCKRSFPWTGQHFYTSVRKVTQYNPEGLLTRCKECYSATSRKWLAENKDRVTAKNLEWLEQNAEKHKRAVQWNLRLAKAEALRAYGGDHPACACCGDDHFEFLSIDHIGGGGAEHRRNLVAATLYRDLKVRGYPAGFRVLCMNCNFAIGKYGYCPHEKQGIVLVDLVKELDRRKASGRRRTPVPKMLF